MFDLEVFDLYYQKNRQVGHTLSLLNGAKSDKNILVVFASNMQRNYIDLPKEQFINLGNLKQDLMGRKNPVLIDHFTMQMMYYEMRKELEKKDESIIELKAINKILRNRLKAKLR